MTRRAVYTAVLGGYEAVLSKPPASDIDYICFTDDPGLSSDRWNIQVIEPRLPMDSVRSARHLKLVGHEALLDYDETLWVDNRIDLLSDPNELLDDWLDGADISMPSHSFREIVMDEFVAVLDSGFDEPFRVYEQLFHYMRSDAEVLQQRPFWTAIIARRHTSHVASAMNIWRDQVLRYSRRDQLSINVALTRAGLSARSQPLDNLHSSQHYWRSHDEVRRPTHEATRHEAAHLLLPPAAHTRDLEIKARDEAKTASAYREAAIGLTKELGIAESHRQQLLAEVANLHAQAQAGEALRQELTTRRDEQDAALDRTREEVSQLQNVSHELMTQLEDLKGSTSWRLTQPVRAASGALRRGTRRVGNR